MQNSTLRQRTVKLIARIMRPFVEEGVILLSEEQIMIANLKHLANRGKLMPTVVPRLINQKEAAEMLGLGYSNFKKLEKENVFPFCRRMVGSSVRYRNVDIIEYIVADNSSP
jgi:predicted DNA-binding transcriptional regulator AlpA